jgi:SGNH hydrolase-like domain, acetyltransferase AlgX
MSETRSAEKSAAFRRRARHALAFAIVLAIQFGVFEAALRMWGSSEAAPAFQGLFTGDPAIGYRLKPGAHVRFTTAEFDTDIAINATGVRDEEPLGPKAPDERRIVILGDSLVLSVQVAWGQTFGELLEARLNARSSGHHYRVINAGVQGYGPVEELLLFRSLAATLQPDLLIETLFVGNDAEEAVTSASKLKADSRPAASAVGESLSTRLRRIVRRSMVLQVLRLRVVSATERFSGALGTPEPPLQSYAATPAPRIAQGLTITRECVAEIASTASASGARTAVMLMPARFQIDDADFGRLKEAVAQSGGELVRDAATSRFDAALAGLPLPRLDVLPALRAALPGPDLFFQQTVHLTPRGHEIVADALDRFIQQQHLLDETPAPR